MFVSTERSRAEVKTNEIKDLLQQSHLHFCLWESPFSVNFKVSKKFYRDNSKPLLDSGITESEGAGEQKKTKDAKAEISNLKLNLKERDEEIAEKNNKIKELEKNLDSNDNSAKAFKILQENEHMKVLEKSSEIKILQESTKHLSEKIKEKDEEKDKLKVSLQGKIKSKEVEIER